MVGGYLTSGFGCDRSSWIDEDRDGLLEDLTLSLADARIDARRLARTGPLARLVLPAGSDAAWRA